MARTVQLACTRCGHSQTYVVECTENDDAVAQTVRASGGREVAVDDTSAAMRLRRLESLPASMPVGGIITPV
ncbi:MAG TPA: hypothetical protein VN734_11465 [Acidobacteriaceae bacterium]|nr:hypothetical protein [Acidobacteriaceae bacterium]